MDNDDGILIVCSPVCWFAISLGPIVAQGMDSKISQTLFALTFFANHLLFPRYQLALRLCSLSLFYRFSLVLINFLPPLTRSSHSHCLPLTTTVQVVFLLPLWHALLSFHCHRYKLKDFTAHLPAVGSARPSVVASPSSASMCSTKGVWRPVKLIRVRHFVLASLYTFGDPITGIDKTATHFQTRMFDRLQKLAPASTGEKSYPRRIPNSVQAKFEAKKIYSWRQSGGRRIHSHLGRSWMD